MVLLTKNGLDDFFIANSANARAEALARRRPTATQTKLPRRGIDEIGEHISGEWADSLPRSQSREPPQVMGPSAKLNSDRLNEPRREAVFERDNAGNLSTLSWSLHAMLSVSSG
jgi:hypothetical protein